MVGSAGGGQGGDGGDTWVSGEVKGWVREVERGGGGECCGTEAWLVFLIMFSRLLR